MFKMLRDSQVEGSTTCVTLATVSTRSSRTNEKSARDNVMGEVKAKSRGVMPVAFRLGDGALLGWVNPPLEPSVVSALPFINNQGFNGGTNLYEQVETDFFVAPGPSFTVTVSLALGGSRLTLRSEKESFNSVEFLDVVAVRSALGWVQSTRDGFSVDVPSEASEAAPVVVDVDVAIPTSFSGASFMIFYAEVTWPAPRGAGFITGRAIPLRE
jgi:hypothetical protein